MKCIQRHGATQIERVSDEYAFDLVRSGRATYKPKWMFKRQPKEGVAVTRGAEPQPTTVGGA